jgi:Protein of unknown function (DUF1269)
MPWSPGALTDIGINDKFMKETAAAIQPGTAALFVLVRRVTADKVLEGLKDEGGTVLKTSLDHTKGSRAAGSSGRCPGGRTCSGPLSGANDPKRRPSDHSEPRFICSACGKRSADVRPDFNWNTQPVGAMGYR